MPFVSQKDIKRAEANLAAFGDTDVFPFPFENWFIKERPDQVRAVVQDIDANFDTYIETFPPQFESTLAPAGYTGFRWVTQIDPFWNLYLLSMMISIGNRIEAARIPASENIVHSYRFDTSADHRIFSPKFGWSSFMEESYRLSQEYSFVVATDISEFYRRLNHHRIENALEHVVKNVVPDRIIAILSQFSGGSSYGIPVGGPAARMLSEITIKSDRQNTFC